MSDATAATPAKASKKKAASKPKKPAAHPKWSDMIRKAIQDLKDKKGSSKQAIHKYIQANYKVGDSKAESTHLKQALKAGVKNGTLNQVKGTGASGSFKLSEKAKAKPKKAAAPKAKKPKAKKPKAAKPAAEKKAKKPKAKKPKSPKKAAAKPKKAKSPKKAKAAKPKAKKASKPKAKKAAAKK